MTKTIIDGILMVESPDESIAINLDNIWKQLLNVGLNEYLSRSPDAIETKNWPNLDVEL